MVAIATWSFWLLLATVLYVYAGFPLLVVVVGKLRHRRVEQRSITPTISLIIAAYNEERNIAERLANALALEYPSNALEIIVASDGSTDATASIVATYASHGVRLLSLPRRGKIHALNDAVAQATGELLVFSDANTLFDPRALLSLARNFADPEVGGVAGSKVYTLRPGSESSSQGEALYWSYDKWLKQMESLTGSIVSADGAIYAIRRTLYRPLSDSAVTDDFAISTAVVEHGYRLVFESEACAYEVAIPSADREFWRKVRLMTRGLRGLILRRRLLNPFRYGFYALLLFSHKMLRRLIPVLLLLMFPACILASPGGTLYLGAIIAQVCFYGLACVGYVFRRTHIGKQKCFYVPFFYCLANAAALIAIIKLIRGEHIHLWEPQRHNVEA
jgi:cellulose synthase/poly-beta-1,6-N-acetylglucosamine synthase-like glycosyltransferase